VEDGTSTWRVTASAVNTSGPSDSIVYIGNDWSGSLRDAEWNTSDMYANMLGDICQYLAKTDSALVGYRLPLPDEYQLPNYPIVWNTTTPSEGGWLKGSDRFTVPSLDYAADGREDFMAFGSAINQEMGVVLPGTLYLGPPVVKYLEGFYWSANRVRVLGDVMHFSVLAVYFRNVSYWHFLSVRCIRKLPGDP
jgi:hypothetical protein